MVVTDVFVSLGAKDVTFVLVDPYVEGDAMLYDRQVKGREKDVIVCT